jgi:hypothetical protein
VRGRRMRPRPLPCLRWWRLVWTFTNGVLFDNRGESDIRQPCIGIHESIPILQLSRRVRGKPMRRRHLPCLHWWRLVWMIWTFEYIFPNFHNSWAVWFKLPFLDSEILNFYTLCLEFANQNQKQEDGVLFLTLIIWFSEKIELWKFECLNCLNLKTGGRRGGEPVDVQRVHQRTRACRAVGWGCETLGGTFEVSIILEIARVESRWCPHIGRICSLAVSDLRNGHHVLTVWHFEIVCVFEFEMSRRWRSAASSARR